MRYKILDLGVTDYLDCYRLQKQLHTEVKYGRSDGYIIVTEHRPVITIGRIGSEKNLLVSSEFLKSRNIDFVKTDRGGDITYHGPGQIVLYPIIKIGTDTYFPRDVHKYLHYLEDVAISFLEEYGIEGYKITDKTGVWTDNGKIASIGIGVSRWVTFHGLAINVDCDLQPFKWINPCGFKDIKVTSMEKMGTVPILRSKTWDCPHFLNKKQIKQRLVEIFCNMLVIK